jgi:hypothetical protein
MEAAKRAMNIAMGCGTKGAKFILNLLHESSFETGQDAAVFRRLLRLWDIEITAKKARGSREIRAIIISMPPKILSTDMALVFPTG